MIDLKVIIRELLSSLDLTRARALCIYELREVIMVCIDEDLIFAAV